ncbi:MAG: cation:dicarboxylase symporter family transporter [Planctomycetaceae bacterium]|nr:cation:dicarboxylase symporter family transporter [Planctomycetales bacterium]MCB9927772.1 cation:dicarboxylase symporter family transporter [Planctomycetaceae bacterium]
MDPRSNKIELSTKRPIGRWICLGLLLGIVCGVLFGEYCTVLQPIGDAYVALLQMTVLPYLAVSLIAKTGRLDLLQARRLGIASLVTLLLLWLIGVALVVAMAALLPPQEGAAFFSPDAEHVQPGEMDVLSTFIPTNVFRSLADEVIPAVVVFCLFLGIALIEVPGKEPFLDFLDVCVTGVGHINTFLIGLAPVGLFALTATAAGTLRLDELARLQAYLIMFSLACAVAVFGVLPALVSSLTTIRYRDLMRAAQEPALTAIATGKLIVVLPQIIDKCEQMIKSTEGSGSAMKESTPSVTVPLAYPFPHFGKILAFVFISFAAWYTGSGLTLAQTASSAATGAICSFASPLVTIPYLLDEFHLPHDLLELFILPGFVTMRLADVVGVLHLMTLTLIVNEAIHDRLCIRWRRLAVSTGMLLLCLGMFVAAGRWYLSATALTYDLDDRLLSLQVPSPHDNVVVYTKRQEVADRDSTTRGTLDRIRSKHVLRVGYHADHLPYSFFNQAGQLVGLDIELMHRLAARLKVRLEFVPYDYATVLDQMESGEIDMAIGGLMIAPERLLQAGFTEPYSTATVSVLMRDHRRGELESWDTPAMPEGVKLAVIHQDLASAARRHLPNAEIIVIDSYSLFFDATGKGLDGLIIAAEEGAAWNVLHPEFTVVVPQPTVQRPVSMAVRSQDEEWLRFLDRWLDIERMDGSLDRLRIYWVEGGGTQDRSPRWCLLRDVMHWIR